MDERRTERSRRRGGSRPAAAMSVLAFGLGLLAAGAAAEPCQPTATRLCLNGSRFGVEVTWRDPRGRTGAGQAVPLTVDTGYFWFFQPSNVELLAKVLDGRGVNGHFWVFSAALTNVEYRLTVTDFRTGLRKTYDNPLGSVGGALDTQALPGKPLAGFGFTPRFFASVDQPWLREENVREFFGELNGRRLGVWAVNGPWWEVLATDGRLIPGFDDILADFPQVRRRLAGGLQFIELATGLPRVEPGSGWEATWEDWNARDGWGAFTQAARLFAARQQPPLLSIGVEINQFARNFPGEFRHFATEVFPEIVQQVGEVSPDTLVFPGFQLEQTLGDLVGFADHNGNPGCEACVPLEETTSIDGRTYPKMVDVLNLFPPQVLTHVGFTTYPYFSREYGTPADLPDDYYSRLYDGLDPAHQGVGLVFTESGWPANEALTEVEACLLCDFLEADAHPVCEPPIVYDGACDAAHLGELIEGTADWLGSEAEQAAFVQRFAELTADLELAGNLWALLHDGDPREPQVLLGLFVHLGFRSHDGSHVRPAQADWLDIWAP